MGTHAGRAIPMSRKNGETLRLRSGQAMGRPQPVATHTSKPHLVAKDATRMGHPMDMLLG